MEPIHEVIDRIKWDKKENPREYMIYYEDRITETNIGIKFTDIKRVDGNFFVIEQEHGETSIPLHRIREVRKNGKLVWSRMLERKREGFLPYE